MASTSLSTSAANNANDNKPRKFSNGSSMDSETGRLLNSLGSVGSSLADVGMGLGLPKAAEENVSTVGETQFQVPASVPQHHQHKPFAAGEEPNIHSSLPRLPNPLEESASHSSSKGSKHLPERRLPSKKRKMSYESYDSAMGDSYLGLATLDSGIHSAIIPKLQPDLGSIATKGSGTSDGGHLHLPGVSALDHLDALGDDGAELPAPAPVLKKPPDEDSATRNNRGGEKDDQSDGDATFTSSGHRLLMEAIMMTSGGGGGGGLEGGGRKRFESWGGMSDLSVQMGGPDQGVSAAAAIAASALHHTGIIDDITAAANFGGGSVDSSVTDDHLIKPHDSDIAAHGRDRTTSFSDSTFPVPSSLDGLEISSDLQKFVAAAVASVGDQLAELAGNIESAAAAVDLYKPQKDDDTRHGSEVSSIATPLMLGASLDDPPRLLSGESLTQPTNLDIHGPNTNSGAALSVDYDAVAAAVDAAHAATGDLDLSAIGEGTLSTGMAQLGPVSSTASSISSGVGGKIKQKRKLPTHGRKSASFAHPSAASHVHLLKDVPKSSLSEKEQEEIRERARKAAGYVPPSHDSENPNLTPGKRTLPPLKKRCKRMTPEPVTAKSNPHTTPKISNTTSKVADNVPSYVVSSSAGLEHAPASNSKAGTKEKSTQKWDSMFDCLIEFIQERKDEETTDATEEAITEWTWDGNVPTTYKTKDGKALGRWINNQRSAKSKGTLKEEREKRLVDAGLKWSVLASNSWNEMLDELRIYIKEYTKDGKKWDGNVPTNYRIKARANGKKMSEEDKNLGRWVNRQRSLYQAGKLRKDRQLALEKVGLKWSMLATTSWEAMFDTLVEYVKEKESKGIKWDGNVPANYRTEDHPPRALGRWINRQRSAHVKKKLKKEYVEKLSNMGLKWSVHERKLADEPRSNEERIVGSKAPGAASPPIRAEVKSTDTQNKCSSSSGDARGATVPSTIAVPAKQSDQGQVEKIQAQAPVPERVSSVRFDDVGGSNENKGNQGNLKSLEETKETSTGSVTNSCPCGANDSEKQGCGIKDTESDTKVPALSTSEVQSASIEISTDDTVGAEI